MSKFHEALVPWIKGAKIVATRENEQYGDLMVLTKRTAMKEDYYSIHRAFMLGDTVSVSADLVDASHEEMIQHLFADVPF